jgi:hypothetical protein
MRCGLGAVGVGLDGLCGIWDWKKIGAFVDNSELRVAGDADGGDLGLYRLCLLLTISCNQSWVELGGGIRMEQ